MKARACLPTESGVRRMTTRTRRAAAAAWIASLLSLTSGIACAASDATPGPLTAGISEGFRFDQKDGESLYRAVCQSCHMADGQGAQGAGMYPALAGNTKLAASSYPAYNVLHGRKGMPSFKYMLSDEQVAEVTNYVRTHMGNAYKDPITAATVKALRGTP
jgi:mono/diheme cytochrome c family protein